jgi:hypothetical protein
MLHRARVTFCPTDSNGECLGPGQASQIEIRISAGHIVGSLADNLDGTYGQVVEYSSGAKPIVNISIADEPIEPVPIENQHWICQLIKKICKI